VASAKMKKQSYQVVSARSRIIYYLYSLSQNIFLFPYPQESHNCFPISNSIVYLKIEIWRNSFWVLGWAPYRSEKL